MQKNALFCATGIFLGFAIGFFIANAVTRPGAPAASKAADTTETRAAGPLDPTQSAGPLPPGHPEIGDAAGGTGGAPSATAASTSAEAQAAMSKADAAPKDFGAQLAAGRTFYDLKDYKKAALYLERALAIKPKDFDALVLMGNARYDDSDLAGAAGFYERALEVNPNSPDVRTDFGNTFFMGTPPDYDRAIAEYRKSVALDPRHVNSWKNIASAAIRKGDRATATEAVERLAALEPASAELPSFRQSIEALK
ncbi:MAG TPA: tetratricopeptide repeat protein [Pyrinomonadaceae bacterium]